MLRVSRFPFTILARLMFPLFDSYGRIRQGEVFQKREKRYTVVVIAIKYHSKLVWRAVTMHPTLDIQSLAIGSSI
jgi:hypothetical protein